MTVQPGWFKCSSCGGVFEKGWSDEEALQEMEDTYGTDDYEEFCLVCDDCYKEIRRKQAMNRCMNENCENHIWHHVGDQEILDYYEHK